MRTLVIGDIRRFACTASNYGNKGNSARQQFFRRLCRWLGPSWVIDYLIQLKTTNNCILFVATTMVMHWLKDTKDNPLWV
jgi:hypothetical protein